MNATAKEQQPQRGLVPLIVTYCGYAYALLGLISGANYLFDLKLAIKGWELPADWKIALLGIIGGTCVAMWGHALDSQAYRGLVARKRWIPWVTWPVIVLLALMGVFIAVK